MRLTIGIIADDLTGAADAVAPFAARGMAAGVGFALAGRNISGPDSVTALALSTESRELPLEKMVTISYRSRAATRHLCSIGVQVVYKKIDSTLRGHLRRELDAVRKELPSRIALVCPAFPAQGRVVRQGVVYVNGVPLSPSQPTETRETSGTGGDGNSGEAGATMRDAFGMTGDAKAATVTLSTLRRGLENVEAALKSLTRFGVDTLFFDAETDADLDLLAQLVLGAPERFLPVGAAGLAKVIAARMEQDAAGMAQNVQEFARCTDIFRTRSILVAVGSRNSVSRRQSEFLADYADVCRFETASDKTAFEINAKMEAALASGARVFLITTPDADSVADCSLAPLGQQLWQLLRWNRNTGGSLGLVATGGDTAMQILEGSGMADGLRIWGEIVPGVAVSTISNSQSTDKDLETVPVILKAGGFGDDMLLARIVGLAE